MVRYLHQNGVMAFNEPGAILVRGGWELYEQILGADEAPFYSFFLTDGRPTAWYVNPRSSMTDRR